MAGKFAIALIPTKVLLFMVLVAYLILIYLKTVAIGNKILNQSFQKK